MKHKYIIPFILLFVTEIIFAQNMTRGEYIQEYKELAIKKMKSHGIPASITLAQGALESGNGNSKLAVNANNHFGIKCHGWKGPSIRIDDDKSNECFRKYKKVEDSYDDHGDFIRYRDRYSFLFELEITDYKGWAYGLKKAGYATNPKYAQLLIKIIEENNLYRYDREASTKRAVKTPSPAKLEAVVVLNPLNRSNLYKHSTSRTIYSTNKVPFIVAEAGDTYKNIAKEYNLFYKELLRFNDVKQDATLSAGDKVYLRKKKSKAPRGLDVHFIVEGDTYYSISQRYGVSISSILKYNEITLNHPLIEGEELYLRKKKYK